jgi:CTP-dependent riboflavin kinase
LTPERVFKGVVVPGRGLAVPAMSRPATMQAIAQFTSLKIVPGTLNVELPEPFNAKLPNYVSVEALGGIPGVPNRKGLRFGEVLIAHRFRGYVFQGDEPEYSPDTVELISDHKLRADLNLKDGDTIEFSMIGKETVH